MLRWWRARRRRLESIEATADDWIARHGRRARRLARLRSMDAYMLGDLEEQERWGLIREAIDQRLGNDFFTPPK
jgi:hypothetical protein